MTKRHGNKEGTIYKRKDGRWCAQVSVNGRRLTKYGKTQGEVREWRNETINQLDQDIAAAALQTLEEYLSAWLEAVKPSIRPRSYETYEWNIRHHINPGLGHIKLRELRPDQIQRYYASRLSNGTGVATVRMSHCVLRGALGHAVKWGQVAQNVSEVVTPPKTEKQEMSVWSVQQVRRFLQVSEGHPWDALFYLAVTTGLRKPELTGLYWSDLDWDNGKLRIQRQMCKGRVAELKTASGRRVAKLALFVN